MKKLTISLLLLFTITIISAQPWKNNLPKEKSEEELTFYDYVNAFNDYWKPFNVDKGFYYENGVKKKAIGWKQFQRWVWNYQNQIDPKTGKFPDKTAQQVYDEYLKSNPSMAPLKDANWTCLGTGSSTGGYAGIGRLNCIAFHPSDNNTYWVGAPAGGLWKTTNNGTSWTCLTDNNSVLGVSDIVIPSDYATSNTIYIATGDRDASDNRSVGVLKSTNGGLSWGSTGLSYTLANNRQVPRILLDPNNNQILIAAATNGVFKTTNGGTNWSSIFSTSFIDMEYKPGDFNTLYASTSNSGRVYMSTNGGLNWTITMNVGGGRTEIAVSPNQPNWVYAIVAASDNGLKGIYKSTDSGVSFVQTFDGTISGHNLLGWAYEGNDTGGQGWYDLSIASSPTNANVVVIGGVNNWRSTDGGSNWGIITHWWGDRVQAVHADQHMARFRSNGDLFICNDGGVYASNNNGTVLTDKTNGIIISQMYRLGVSQTVENEVITGLQDNGTKLYTSNTWADVKGGDGMECIIDYTNVNIQYGTYVCGQISRTMNHWSSSVDIEPASGAWVTPYIIDPLNPSTIYAGYSNVWKTTNRGSSWIEISTMNTSNYIQSMAIAPSNTNVLYVADNNHLWKTTNGGTDWALITGTLPVGSGSITSIAVKNDDANTVWVTLGGYNANKIFVSTDGGTTWTNISTGLPQLPVYSIVQNKQSLFEVQLYAGTELGVYFKKGTADWVPYNTGLPNVKIGELEIYYAPSATNSKLRAATYGRGLWETPVFPALTSIPKDELSENGINIYPNPTKGIFNIDFLNKDAKNIELVVKDLNGKIVFSGSFDKTTNKTIDLSNQPAGMYLIQLKVDKKSYNTQIIKE